MNMKKIMGMILIPLLITTVACGGGGKKGSAGGASTYTVTYNANGADTSTSDVPVDINTYTSNSSIAVLAVTGTLAKAGYTLEGWSTTAAQGSGTIYHAGDHFQMGTNNITLYAKWTLIPTYRVYYHSDNYTQGNTLPDDTNNYKTGEQAGVDQEGLFSAYTRTGYTCVGWTTHPDGSGPAVAAVTVGSADTDLYPCWTANPVYTVTYETNDENETGALPAVTSHEAGVTVSVAYNINLQKPGYAFLRWKDKTGTETYDQGSIFNMAAANLVLVPVWEPVYTIVYDDNRSWFESFFGTGDITGEAPADPNEYRQGAAITVLDQGTLENAEDGFYFDGWCVNEDGSGDTYYSSENDTIQLTADFIAGHAVDGVITVHAKWTELPKHNLVYDANNGTAPVPGTTSHHKGDTVTLSTTPAPTRDGYTFSGWTLAADTGSAVSSVVMGDLDITVFAKWTEVTVPTYAVSYDGNECTNPGDIPVDGISYVSGASVTVKPNALLYKTGYQFIGWNTVKEGTGTWYYPPNYGTFSMPEHNVTLYAQWKKAWTITYNGNGNSGGSAPAATSHLDNSVATVANNVYLVKTGYVFAGWNTDQLGNGSPYLEGDTFTITSDVSLYAQWAVAYTVTYDANGGTGQVPQDTNYYSKNDSTLVLSNSEADPLVRTGYFFTGWNTLPDGLGDSYTAGTYITMPAHNVTLYAQWTPAANTVYTVTYNANYPSGSSSQTGTAPSDATNYEQDQTIIILGNTGNLYCSSGSIPYKFTGWNTSTSGGGTVYLPGQEVSATANLVLYAQWTLSDTYKVTYFTNGATNGTAPADGVNYLYGATVTVQYNTGNLVKAGYAFAGWNTDPLGNGTSYLEGDTFQIQDNTSLHAQWVEAYRVTYNGNGNDTGSVPADNLMYTAGQQPVVMGNTSASPLVKANCIFVGWTTSPKAVDQNDSDPVYTQDSLLPAVTGNVTLYAKWVSASVTTYSVTYYANGATSGTAPADSGQYILNQAVAVLSNTGNLARTGYVFGGWNTNSAGTGTTYQPSETFSITGNTNLYAKWVPSKKWYSITSSRDGSVLAAVANGDYGYISNDYGSTWPAGKKSTSVGTGKWYGIAGSSDGSKLAVANYNKGKSFMYYGSTATGWDQPSGTKGNFTTVASTADGSILYAAEWKGAIYRATFSGGKWTWSSVYSAISNEWRSIACSGSGGRIAAVATSGAGYGYIYTSSNGGSAWQKQTGDSSHANAAARDWYSVSYASSGDGLTSILVAVEKGGNIWISKDFGATWTSKESARAWRAVTCLMSTDGSRSIIAAAVEGGFVYVSTDGGETWASRASARTWYSLTAWTTDNGATWGLAGAVYNGQIWTSSDSGAAWTMREAN